MIIPQKFFNLVLSENGLSGYSKYFYERIARSVTGVADVKILDQHPRGQGTVDIIIKGTAGVPTLELLENVKTAIAAEAPQNDDYLVKGVMPHGITIELELECLAVDLDKAKLRAENQIRLMFTNGGAQENATKVEPMLIGEDYAIDRLVATVMGIGQIKKINRAEPLTDVVIPDDGLAVLQSLLVTVKQAEQI